ncbi:MAG: FAD-binding oxidoreductase [Oligoflexia bacterium]|nr:FAD-binding oxidoreductase [Oligoflexia bacterium]
MTSVINDLERIVGKAHLITDDSKYSLAKDYTKAFTPDPLLILQPGSTEEVQETLKYCNLKGISVVPSGGRTGLSGGAVATQKEVVLSLSRMNKILEINETERTIRAQAGVVTKQLQKAASEKGLYFPVDFASSGSSHIGGNVATNAGGIKVIRYGLIRDWTLGLKVVLADGRLLELDNACVKNNTGLDLRQLFVGSEGTLGVITECLMKLTAPPKDLLVSVFALDSLENVLKLFELTRTMRLNLTAYEFFTQFGLKKVEEHTHLPNPFSNYHPYYALVEIEKAHDADLENLEKFMEKGFESGLILDGVQAQSSTQAEQFWGLRENIAESLTALTVAHKNDISLPMSRITRFCQELEGLIQKEYKGFEVVNFGHIGDGNLHVNFIKPPSMTKEDFFLYAKKADLSMFELVKRHGGSISAEHGIGLTKKPFLHFTRTPDEIALMKGIKSIFDPKGILNPGKVF